MVIRDEVITLSYGQYSTYIYSPLPRSPAHEKDIPSLAHVITTVSPIWVRSRQIRLNSADGIVTVHTYSWSWRQQRSVIWINDTDDIAKTGRGLVWTYLKYRRPDPFDEVISARWRKKFALSSTATCKAYFGSLLLGHTIRNWEIWYNAIV